MQESHVATRECGAHVRLGHLFAKVHAELEGTRGFERGLLSLHGTSLQTFLDALVSSSDAVVAVERAIDDVHLLFASQADEVHRVT